MESSRQIEDRAAEWLARQDSEEWTRADQTELDEWLTATAHRVAYIRLKQAWNETHRLKALGAGTKPGVVPPVGEWRVSPFLGAPAAPEVSTASSTRKSWRPLAIAASVMLVTGAAVVAWYSTPTASTFRTPIGGVASVPMSDGSKVTLNTNSQVRLAISETERRVELAQGEAFFEVAHDPARPFVVRAGDKDVVAVGTQFSVRRDGDDLQIVVTEGKVRVHAAGAGAAPWGRVGGVGTGGGGALYLKAGTVARASAAGTLVQEKSVGAAEDILSWRSGYVIFQETPLTEAVEEFNRYNTRKLIIQDPALARVKLTGSFRSTNLAGFVRLLEQGFAISARSTDAQIVLTTSGQ